jgi:hypothetical protein
MGIGGVGFVLYVMSIEIEAGGRGRGRGSTWRCSRSLYIGSRNNTRKFNLRKFKINCPKIGRTFLCS